MVGPDAAIVVEQGMQVVTAEDVIEGKAKEIHKVGDCLAPRRVINAIYEGYKVAMEL